MYTVNLLVRLVENHQILVYFLLFIGLILEGEFFLISTGILVHLGALNLWVALVFLLLGGFSTTFLGYALGEFLYKKFGYHKFFKFIQKRVYNVLPRFKITPFWSIFASKFIIGANHLVIIFSGYEKINYKKFLQAEITATLIWIPLFLSLGYFFSYTALRISREIWKFLAVVLILFIVFILFDKLVSWFYELFEEYHYDN
ncbi:MAG: VTT domain-containing protein [Patescibacteria group bacterium]